MASGSQCELERAPASSTSIMAPLSACVAAPLRLTSGMHVAGVASEKFPQPVLHSTLPHWHLASIVRTLILYARADSEGLRCHDIY